MESIYFVISIVFFFLKKEAEGLYPKYLLRLFAIALVVFYYEENSLFWYPLGQVLYNE